LSQIAVIIPCRNERDYISECIHAIADSDLEAGDTISIFIVDGMSNDGTRHVIKEIAEKFSFVNVIDNTHQLTPFAFNLGIKSHFKDVDFFQIVGSRHIISKYYLRVALKTLRNDENTWCVGGKLINSYTNFLSEVISKCMASRFGMGIGNFRTLNDSGYTDTVTSPMYPKFVFERIGFFDEELVRNQDDDFNYRVAKAGGKIFFSSEISLKYYVRSNFQSLWKQFYQYGYWKVYVNKKHSTITTLRQVIPALFVIFLMTFPFTFVSKPFFIMFVAILNLYLILALLTSVRVSKHFKGVIYSVFTFIILHVGYGLGYLNGIIDFALIGKRPSDKHKTLSR
jgi:GT2 family glycosyltransferase